jgi:hypothetical protein
VSLFFPYQIFTLEDFRPTTRAIDKAETKPRKQSFNEKQLRTMKLSFALVLLVNAAPVLAAKDFRIIKEMFGASDEEKVVANSIVQGVRGALGLKAGVNTDNYDEVFVEAGITAYIPGIHASKLSGEEKAFMEDALMVSYNKVHKGTDYYSFSNRMVASDSHAAPTTATTTADLAADNLGRYSNWGSSRSTYYGGYGCRFCPNDFDILGAHEGLGLAKDTLLNSWEDTWCNMLKTSRYDIFRAQNVGRCVIVTDYGM